MPRSESPTLGPHKRQSISKLRASRRDLGIHRERSILSRAVAALALAAVRRKYAASRLMPDREAWSVAGASRRGGRRPGDLRPEVGADCLQRRHDDPPARDVGSADGASSGRSLAKSRRRLNVAHRRRTGTSLARRRARRQRGRPANGNGADQAPFFLSPAAARYRRGGAWPT